MYKRINWKLLIWGLGSLHFQLGLAFVFFWLMPPGYGFGYNLLMLLGLMVVYKCIHAHDGRIGLTSREGEGTVFHIALPLDERPVRLLAAPTVVPLEAEAIPPTDPEG